MKKAKKTKNAKKVKKAKKAKNRLEFRFASKQKLLNPSEAKNLKRKNAKKCEKSLALFRFEAKITQVKRSKKFEAKISKKKRKNRSEIL